MLTLHLFDISGIAYGSLETPKYIDILIVPGPWFLSGFLGSVQDRIIVSDRTPQIWCFEHLIYRGTNLRITCTGSKMLPFPFTKYKVHIHNASNIEAES